MHTQDFTKILDVYRHELLVNTIPFWTQHTIDKRYGGIFSAITDDAKIVTTDKYLWSQLREYILFPPCIIRSRREMNGWILP
jgi:N-acylglucosamine 2-epimerase